MGPITRTQVIRTERRIIWEKRPGGWQLPCGCIGPAIWSSSELGQSYCDDCGRGWMQMGRTNGRVGSDRYCAMLDGKPQGEPVLILTQEKIIAPPIDCHTQSQ